MNTLDVSLLKRPLKLAPDNFTHQMWGGQWIPQFKGLPAPADVPVGESWEFSSHPQKPSMVTLANGAQAPLPELIAQFPTEILGSHFISGGKAQNPLLVKFIDARDDLSLQLHPSDDHARRFCESDSGKSEAWLILDVATGPDDGFIYLGFDEQKARDYSNHAEFHEAFFNALNQANAMGPSTDVAVRAKAQRVVVPFLNRIRVKPGDVYDLKPGTLHAIGRGVRLLETQQNSDLTYRVWDWNRPDTDQLKRGKLSFRALHLDKAKHILSAVDDRSAGGPAKFAIERRRFATAGESAAFDPAGRFHVLTVVQGEIAVDENEVKRGHSVLIPAGSQAVTLRAATAKAEVVRSYVPG